MTISHSDQKLLAVWVYLVLTLIQGSKTIWCSFLAIKDVEYLANYMHTLLATNIYPPSRHFWVDDSPFPVWWDMDSFPTYFSSRYLNSGQTMGTYLYLILSHHHSGIFQCDFKPRCQGIKQNMDVSMWQQQKSPKSPKLVANTEIHLAILTWMLKMIVWHLTNMLILDINPPCQPAFCTKTTSGNMTP